MCSFKSVQSRYTAAAAAEDAIKGLFSLFLSRMKTICAFFTVAENEDSDPKFKFYPRVRERN